MHITINCCKMGNEQIILPKYQTIGSAGCDIRASIKEPVDIAPGEYKLIPSGLAIALPDGFEAQIRPRSGLALKYGLTILNSPATIDSDYRGEIKILLINFSKQMFTVKNNDRIAQLVISSYATCEFKLVDEISTTNRDNKGFGSTGIE